MDKTTFIKINGNQKVIKISLVFFTMLYNYAKDYEILNYNFISYYIQRLHN